MASRIRMVRGEQTLVSFAAAYGIGLSTLNRWEKAETAPDSVLLGVIARHEGFDGHWLLTGEGDPKPTGERSGRLCEADMELLLDCYAAGELILRDHNKQATHEEKKAASIKMFLREKAGGSPMSAVSLAHDRLDSNPTQA